jgi:hypothetical protein
MAFDFLESFDLYAPVGGSGPDGAAKTYMNANGWYSIAGDQWDIQTGLLGGYRLYLGNGGAGNNARGGRHVTPSKGKSFGLFVEPVDMGLGTPAAFLQLYYTAAAANTAGTSHGQLNFRISTDGRLQVYRGSTYVVASDVLLAQTDPGLFASGVEVAIEGEVYIDDTVGRVKVWVDNDLVLNFTGDTQAQATDQISGAWLWSDGNGTSAVFLDDFWMWDTDAKPTVAPIRSVQLKPSGDTGTNQWTPSTGTSHFAVVDDATMYDAPTDYLSGSTVGDVDELALPDLAYSPAQIAAVQVVGMALKTDATAREINLGVSHNGTISDGPNYALSASTQLHRRIMAKNAADTDWTQANINDLKLRAKVAV